MKGRIDMKVFKYIGNPKTPLCGAISCESCVLNKKCKHKDEVTKMNEVKNELKRRLGI